MANREFALALKKLRIKYKLSQAAVAGVAKITQPEYSAFERLKRKLNLDDADSISAKVWGKSYSDFVSFAKKKIDVSSLPKATQAIIKNAQGKKMTDSSNFLATELDRLISEGHLNTPTTAKILHSKMDSKLANRKSTEITSHLTRSPRNKEIIALKTVSSPKVFVHKDYASKYEKMSREEVLETVGIGRIVI